MSGSTLQRHESRREEEPDPQHAETLIFKEAYAEMVERRIRFQNPRPQTPPGLNLAERIMWKRDQMRDEQSYRGNSPLVDPEDISTDVEHYTDERIEMLPPVQPPPRYSAVSIAENSRTSPYPTPRSPDNSLVVVATGSTQGLRESPPNDGPSLGSSPSLLAIPVENDSLTRRNSAPNRTKKPDVENSSLERRNSTITRYEKQKGEKRRKKEREDKTKDRKPSRDDTFAEKNKKRNDKTPSAEDKETLKKIEDLENKVDRNLDDLLGDNRQNMAFLLDLDDADLDALLEKL